MRCKNNKYMSTMFGATLYQCLINVTPAPCLTLNIMFSFIYKKYKIFECLVLFVISRKNWANKYDPKAYLKMFTQSLWIAHIIKNRRVNFSKPGLVRMLLWTITSSTYIMTRYRLSEFKIFQIYCWQHIEINLWK